jgi:predicted metal-binding protein
MPKMIFPSADPLNDFYRQDVEDYEAEQRCPVCSNCGKRIPPCESIFEARFRNQNLILCEDCCGESDWQMLVEMEGQL